MLEAKSGISNLTSLFVRPGDQINLTCTIEAPEESDFVYWYKNKESIQFDNLKARRLHHLAKKNTKRGPGRPRRALIVRSETADHRASDHEQLAKLRMRMDELEESDNIRQKNKQQPEEEEGDGEADTKEGQKLHRFTSALLIKRSQANDTANYTCQVSS